uniref:HTH_Tnp_IS630 domain-containing protein n=1 Tax=Strongyloides papillosus TaxID=174720 RepID=A0A0N5BTR0_STREA
MRTSITKERRRHKPAIYNGESRKAVEANLRGTDRELPEDLIVSKLTISRLLKKIKRQGSPTNGYLKS